MVLLCRAARQLCFIYSSLPLFFAQITHDIGRVFFVCFGASDSSNFCGTPFQMLISCNDFLKASIIFKGSALHSSGSSQEVWHNGGQNGQRRCPPTETHTCWHTHTHIGREQRKSWGGVKWHDQTFRKVETGLLHSVDLKCKHVPLCWPVASLLVPPTETPCLHVS